jgi:serine O-acetyltransferase
MSEETSLGHLLRADVHRITGRMSLPDVVWQSVRGEAFRYNLALRLAGAAQGPVSRLLGRLWLRRQRLRLGINIPATTRVGPGLLIGHPGGIVVNAATVLGRDCNVSHNVTIGVSRGKRSGVPRIGDRVYFGPGAVVFGDITIGNDVAIGANAVVTTDVPDGMTAVGSPCRIIGGGSGDYIRLTTGQVVGGGDDVSDQ